MRERARVVVVGGGVGALERLARTAAEPSFRAALA